MLGLEQWLSALELKIEIYVYIVQVRSGRCLYTWVCCGTCYLHAGICTAALPVTRVIKNK